MKYFITLAAVGVLALLGVGSKAPASRDRDAGMMPEVVVIGEAPESPDGMMPEVVVRPSDSAAGSEATVN